MAFAGEGPCPSGCQKWTLEVTCLMHVRTPCVGGPPQTCASGGPAGDVPANTSVIIGIITITITTCIRSITVITGRGHTIIAQAFLVLVFFLELTYWCLVGNQGSC